MAEYLLPIALSKVRAARMNFAFFQGAKSNQVYVSAKPANAKQVSELEGECGNPKCLFKGICFLENDQLVFATKAAPSPSWETMITKVFKDKKAAKFLPIVMRQLSEAESDEVTAEETGDGVASPASSEPTTEPAGSQGAVDDAETLRQLKAEITPRVNNVIRSNPSSRDELLGLVKKGLDQEKAGAFASALSFFRQLEAKLPAATPTGAVPPPPPPPPQAPPPPGGRALSASELSLAMQKLVPRLQQAVSAEPARRTEILAPAARFQAALNAGKLGEAQAAMMDALALVKTLAPGAPAVDSAEDVAFKATWKKATQVWLDCVGTVDGQIEKLRKALQGLGDPDFDDIAARGLPALTDNHKTPVMVAVREVQNASGDTRASAAKKAQAAIANFRTHLVTDDRIATCDEECEAEFGVKLTIREEIGRGLDELETALEEIPAL